MAKADKKKSYLYILSFTSKHDKVPNLHYFHKKRNLDYINIIKYFLESYIGFDTIEECSNFKKLKKDDLHKAIDNILETNSLKIHDIKSIQFSDIKGERLLDYY